MSRDLLAPVAALGRLPLLARGTVEGTLTGLHASPFHGFSAEFSEHREYVPGDDPGDLDWAAYARTDRPVVRRYKEETNLRCRLVVDASASMGFGTVPLPAGRKGERLDKLGCACRYAACLAWLLLRQRDAVGLRLCRGTGAEDLPFSARPGHLGEILRLLEAVRSGGQASLARQLEETASSIRRRGMVIVLSDLLEDEAPLVQALRRLRHRRHDVILLHLLDPAEESLPWRRPAEFIDPETGNRIRADPPTLRADYREAIRAFRHRWTMESAASGIDYHALVTSEPIETALVRILSRRGR